MIVDDLCIRLFDGTLDSYILTLTDLTLINNYIAELDLLIKSKEERLFYSNDVKIHNAIQNLLFVKNKLYDRIKFLGKDVRW